MVVEGGCIVLDRWIVLLIMGGTLALTLFYLPGAYENYQAAYSQVEAGTILNIMPPIAMAYAKASLTIATVFLILSFAYVLWEQIQKKGSYYRGGEP